MIKHIKPIAAVVTFPWVLLYDTGTNVHLFYLFGLIAALEYAEIWFDRNQPLESKTSSK